MNRLFVPLYILFALGGIAACSAPESKETTPETPQSKPLPDFGKHRTVGFVVVDGVYNSELVAPLDLFHHTIFHTDPALKVFTVAPDLDTITTFEGLHFWPDYSFDNCPPIDILVVPSAEHSLDTDLDDAALIAFVKENGEKAEYILSLCDGAFVLAQAGLLDSVSCTTFPGDIEAFRQRFSHLDVQEGISLVHDGKAITSAGGARSFDPAMYLIHHLFGEKVAQGVGRGMVIPWSEEKFQSYKALPLN